MANSNFFLLAGEHLVFRLAEQGAWSRTFSAVWGMVFSLCCVAAPSGSHGLEFSFCPGPEARIFQGAVGCRTRPSASTASRPQGVVDRHVHVAREDRETVVAVVRAGIVPAVHLAERHAHLLEDVLSLMPEPTRSGWTPRRTSRTRSRSRRRRSACRPSCSGRCAGSRRCGRTRSRCRRLHAQVLVGADHVARTQAADVQHDRLALEARRYFAMTASTSGWYFAMTASASS